VFRLAGGWLGMWWCGGVGDEAEEFVNLCVVSVTRLPPPTDSQFPWQVTFQSGRGILGKGRIVHKYSYWLPAGCISQAFPIKMRWMADKSDNIQIL